MRLWQKKQLDEINETLYSTVQVQNIEINRTIIGFDVMGKQPTGSVNGLVWHKSI